MREAASALRNAAGNFYINDKPTGAVVGPAAVRRRARIGHERQGRLEAEPGALGQRAHDQGDVRAADRLPLPVHDGGVSPTVRSRPLAGLLALHLIAGGLLVAGYRLPDQPRRHRVSRQRAQVPGRALRGRGDGLLEPPVFVAPGAAAGGARAAAAGHEAPGPRGGRARHRRGLAPDAPTGPGRPRAARGRPHPDGDGPPLRPDGGHAGPAERRARAALRRSRRGARLGARTATARSRPAAGRPRVPVQGLRARLRGAPPGRARPIARLFREPERRRTDAAPGRDRAGRAGRRRAAVGARREREVRAVHAERRRAAELGLRRPEPSGLSDAARRVPRAAGRPRRERVGRSGALDAAGLEPAALGGRARSTSKGSYVRTSSSIAAIAQGFSLLRASHRRGRRAARRIAASIRRRHGRCGPC